MDFSRAVTGVPVAASDSISSLRRSALAAPVAAQAMQARAMLCLRGGLRADIAGHDTNRAIHMARQPVNARQFPGTSQVPFRD